MYDLFVLRSPSITPMWVANIEDAVEWLKKPKYKKRKGDMIIAVESGTSIVRPYAYVVNTKNVRVYNRELSKFDNYDDLPLIHYAWNSVYEDFTGYSIPYYVYEFSSEEERNAKVIPILVAYAGVAMEIMADAGWSKSGEAATISEMIPIDTRKTSRLGIISLDSMARSANKIIELWMMANPYAYPSHPAYFDLRKKYNGNIVYGIARYRVLEVVKLFESCVGVKMATKLIKKYIPLEDFLELV